MEKALQVFVETTGFLLGLESWVKILDETSMAGAPDSERVLIYSVAGWPKHKIQFPEFNDQVFEELELCLNCGWERVDFQKMGWSGHEIMHARLALGPRPKALLEKLETHFKVIRNE